MSAIFRTGVVGLLVALALTVAACDESGGSDETEPTFEDARAIAEEQLAGEPCEFQVEDESTDDLEQKSLDCLTSADGQEQLFSVFHYSRDLEVSEADAAFGGITTAERYFENGNITIDPAGGDPTAIQLDAEEFATALKDSCDCGEVKTPEQ
jgi:hypothetical protein